ncbi:MAG: hypothetical protein JKY45_09760 [Emcibacter sp.]|nr:hypothetical protein [Emcibacter sp.]
MDADVQKNLAKLTQVINEIEDGTDLVLFPELFLHGFVNSEEIEQVSETSDGPALKAVMVLAQEKNITIIVGFAERKSGRFYNSVAWVSPKAIEFIYRKTYLWVCDENVFEKDDNYPVIDFGDLTFGCAICFDIEFPETGRALSGQGANVILVSNGNMNPYGMVHRVSAQARALENHAFVIMCNRVGSARGLEFVGDSVVVGPDGKILAELGDAERVEYFEIDKAAILKSKENYNYLEQISSMPEKQNT